GDRTHGHRTGRGGRTGRARGVGRHRRALHAAAAVGGPRLPAAGRRPARRRPDRVAAPGRAPGLPPRATRATDVDHHDGQERECPGAQVPRPHLAVLVRVRGRGRRAAGRGHGGPRRRAAARRAAHRAAGGFRRAVGPRPGAAHAPGRRPACPVLRHQRPAGHARRQHRADPGPGAREAAGVAVPRGVRRRVDRPGRREQQGARWTTWHDDRGEM
ncbi:MAG: Putative RNA polymerase sigma factor, partial [uncultured Frankineae bacterium]